MMVAFNRWCSGICIQHNVNLTYLFLKMKKPEITIKFISNCCLPGTWKNKTSFGKNKLKVKINQWLTACSVRLHESCTFALKWGLANLKVRQVYEQRNIYAMSADSELAFKVCRPLLHCKCYACVTHVWKVAPVPPDE